MSLCTSDAVRGPLASVVEAVYSRMDKLSLFCSLSHFTKVWDPHVRVVFNLPPQQLLWPKSHPRWHRTTTVSSTFRVDEPVQLAGRSSAYSAARPSLVVGPLITAVRLQQVTTATTIVKRFAGSGGRFAAGHARFAAVEIESLTKA
jgi:hypothetical protein